MKEMTILIGVSMAIGSIVSVVGLAVVESFTRLPSGVQVELPGADPLTLLAAIVAMTTAAGLATYIPSRRAAKADPAVSLRCQ